MKISKKIRLVMITSVTLSLLLLSLVLIVTSCVISTNSMNTRFKKEMLAIRDTKAKTIINYFEDLKRDINRLIYNPMLADSIIEFDKSFNMYAKENSFNQNDIKKDLLKHYINDFGKEFEKHNGYAVPNVTKLINFNNTSGFNLQYNYLIKNGNEFGQEIKLEDSGDRTSYSKSHKKYHSFFTQILDSLKLSDVMLVNNNGVVIYSSSKDFDFTTSFTKGPYKNSHAAKVFHKALAGSSGDIIFSDYEPYLPSFNKPVSFIGVPIVKNGNKLGVLMFKMPVGYISGIMTDNNTWKEIGYSKTLETYLIGKDNTMRSESRAFVKNKNKFLKSIKKVNGNNINLINLKNTTVGLQTVKTEGAMNSLSGKSGLSSYKNYLNKKVLGTFMPIQLFGNKMGLLVEVEKSEIMKSVYSMAIKLIVMCSILVSLFVYVAIKIATKIAYGISLPLEDFSRIIVDIAKSKDLTKRVKVENAEKEIHDIATAINKLIHTLQVVFKGTNKASHDLSLASKSLLNIYSDESEDDIYDSIESLDMLSDKLDALSDQFKIFERNSDITSEW